MRFFEKFFICGFLLGIACKDPGSPPKLPESVTPIPEASKPLFPERPINPLDVGPKRAEDLVSDSLQQRLATPGKVRWFLDFEAPITRIRWSPLKGYSVSSGKEVINVTSRGERRWRQVVGLNHQLFTIDDVEVVWSKAFSMIAELGRRGMTGWSRDWTGGVIGDDRGVFLFDASTVSELGADGRDKWRISLEGIRKVEGPFACREGAMFHGMSGLKRQAVHVSFSGAQLRLTELGRGAQLLGADESCDPLVWQDGELRLISDRGVARWIRAYPNAPLVTRLDGGFLITLSRASLPSTFEIISDSGRTVSSGTLPINGRLCRVDAPVANGLLVQVMEFCLDVTHPCANSDSDRGPYNAIVTSDGKGGFRPLVRYTAGHLNAVSTDDGGLLTAASKEETATDVEMRNQFQNVVWQLTLQGRLSAGPFLGPYGDAYVATCAGWNCGPPYRLFSITMKKPPEETSTDEDTETMSVPSPREIYRGF
jgi:hypothetical protein